MNGPNFTLKLNLMLKKSLICGLMLGVVAFALASSGGGKKKSALHSPAFGALRPTAAFTLRSKGSFSNNLLFSGDTRNNAKIVTYKSVVTYQQGNTIYVLPTQYRLVNASRTCYKTNLNMVDLKIRLPR